MSGPCDLAIRDGTVVTAADQFRADIGVRDGRIVEISERVANARDEIDASGLLVLPGGIDAHVHLAQPTSGGTVMADDFESGTPSAAAGGNTTVLPFALQVRGTSLRECVQAYHEKADGKYYTDVSFHLIVSDPTRLVLSQGLPRTGGRRAYIAQDLHDLRRSRAYRLRAS